MLSPGVLLPTESARLPLLLLRHRRLPPEESWLHLLLFGDKVLDSRHAQSPPQLSEIFQLAQFYLASTLCWTDTCDSHTGASLLIKVFLVLYSKSVKLLAEGKSGRPHLANSLLMVDLQIVLLALKDGPALETVIFGVRLLLFEAKGLGNHAGSIRHGVVVYLNIKGLDEVGEASGVLGDHKLALFQQEHLLVYFFDEEAELVLVAGLLVVELDEPFFERDDQVLEEAVVFGFLLASGEPTVNAHLQFYRLAFQSMNFLGIYLYRPPPLTEIALQVGEALSQFLTPDTNIEIEFKYAELKEFFTSYVLRDLQAASLPPNIRNHVLGISNDHVCDQNRCHLDTIKRLSSYQMVLLNSLEKRYDLKGDFYEGEHKKFYKIREFLVKLCKENSLNLPNNGVNFYRDIQREHKGNNSFHMISFSEMRLDVNIRNGDNAGRYSYELGKGWTRTRKENLIREEFDIMLAQRTFRLAVKKEVEEPFSPEEVSSFFKQSAITFMRFKRSLKVQKGDHSVITLSEVYQPQTERRQNLLEDLKDLVTMDPEFLDEFVVDRFQEFYMSKLDEPEVNDNRSSKFQIESEFTQTAVKRMAEMYRTDRRELERYLDSGLQDLYALFFADHNVKMRETAVMAKMKKEDMGEEPEFPDCRLENEYGSYMHDLIYNYMKD